MEAREDMSVQKCCSGYCQHSKLVRIQHLTPTKVQTCPERLVGAIEVLAPRDPSSIETVYAAVASSRVSVKDVLRDSTEENGHYRDHCTEIGEIPYRTVRTAVVKLKVKGNLTKRPERKRVSCFQVSLAKPHRRLRSLRGVLLFEPFPCQA
jgi:hypothetical protein